MGLRVVYTAAVAAKNVLQHLNQVTPPQQLQVKAGAEVRREEQSEVGRPLDFHFRVKSSAQSRLNRQRRWRDVRQNSRVERRERRWR